MKLCVRYHCKRLLLGVQRKVGILVGARRGDLRENWLCSRRKFTARAHDRLRESGYQIGAELLVRNQYSEVLGVVGSSSGTGSDFPGVPFGTSKLSKARSGLCNGCRGLDWDQHRRLFVVS